MSANKTNNVEADSVFVLMTNEYRVSRNIRAQWYFNNLNRTIQLPNKRELNEFSEEIEIISVINDDEEYAGELERRQDKYYISPKTKVIFLARRYRFVFVLDLSPSLASGDIQNNTIINEEVFSSLSNCLRGLCTPFYVPGSEIKFTPEIFITILAHTSFYTGIKEVLIQGYKLTAQNVEHFLSLVNDRLVNIISLIASITSKAIEQREMNPRGEDLLNASSNLTENVITMTTPDISMVNMYRYSLLALHLLPENSTTGIVIISDGMLSLPNSSMLESMLTQLRNNTIACSFIQVGSSPHPDSCLGYLPYTDLMQFISSSTFGAYLPSCPPIDKIENYEYNLYHLSFLSWYFQRALCDFNLDASNLRIQFDNEWFVNNPYFFHNSDLKTRFSFEPTDLELIRIKQSKNTIPTKFTNMLSCRLRQGFTIKTVNLGKNDTQIEVVLVLPWKYNVNIEYIMRSPWNRDVESDDENAVFSYELLIEGNYNFIHDVTCQVKRPIKSPFRLAAVKQFWATINSFTESDKLLVLLNNFDRKPASPIPQTLISGIPLFYLPPGSTKPVLASKNTADQLFALYWRKICLLDLNHWQKWMHLHRINIILRHDPLPKYLLIPNAHGIYNQVQCRQALISLSDLLKNYSSFVMLENQSYIKVINSEESENGKPFFFILRVVSNFPCIVLYLAFINGVSGYVRHKIVTELRNELQKCKTQFRNIKTTTIKPTPVKSAKIDQRGKENLNKYYQSSNKISPTNESVEKQQESPEKQSGKNVNSDAETACCKILRKPIEKVLVRYEKPPVDYLSSVDQQFFSLSSAENLELKKIIKKEMMATLSRYLHHERFIFTPESLSKETGKSISLSLLGKVLATLLKQRLIEGFHVAHNGSNGIINVALEMKFTGECDTDCPVIVQYVIFPPHNKARIGSQFEIVTEVWIEPQQGLSTKCEPSYKFLENKDYQTIASLVLIMNGSKNDPFLRLNSDIMTSTDLKYWSSFVNHLTRELKYENDHEKGIREQEYYKANREISNNSPPRESINRPKLTPNGSERQSSLSKYEQEIEAKSILNDKEQPDRVEKLSELSSSLSLHPVANVFKKYSNISSISNVSKFDSTSKPFNGKSCRVLSFTLDPYQDGEPWSKNEFLNSQLSDHCSSPIRSMESRNFQEGRSLNSRHNSQISSSSRKNDFQQTTPLSLKKHSLSLPLKRSFSEKSFDLIPQSIRVKNHPFELNGKGDKNILEENFSLNQPNLSLACLQNNTNNRSSTKYSVQYLKRLNTDIFRGSNLEIESNFCNNSKNAELPGNSIDRQTIKSNSENEMHLFKNRFNEKASEQISNRVIDKLGDRITSRLSNKLTNELSGESSNQVKKEVVNSHKACYDDLNHLSKNQRSIRVDIPQSSLLNAIDKVLSKQELYKRVQQNGSKSLSFIDYNTINLKLNSHFVHLVKHSEIDRKNSSLLLNLVTEDYIGIILCLGRSTLIGDQHSIAYYVGAITQSSPAEHLLAVGDMVIEINSTPLQLNSFMNLEKVTTLMNHQFNVDRYLQLRIVHRDCLMSKFKKKNEQFLCDDSIRTVVINAQKRKMASKTSSFFGLTIKGGKEYGLGIWVSNVDKGSLSEQSGLKAGDLIITLNGQDFLNKTHDYAASLIKNTKLLILRVRNVGFVPVSALLLDQNDEINKFRSNSAIEMTDHDRLRKSNKQINKIPIQTIKEELKANGLLSRGEIRAYLVGKYGLGNGSNDGVRNDEMNNCPAYSQLSMMNSLEDGTHQLRNTFENNKINYLNLINYYSSATLVPNRMPSTLSNNYLFNHNNPMPLYSSLTNLSSNLSCTSNLPFSTANNLQSLFPTQLPNALSENKRDNLASLMPARKSDLLCDYPPENELDNELALDEQLNSLNANDKNAFNFYKREYLTHNISLHDFMYSIYRLLNTAEKQNLFEFLRPLVPKVDLKNFDQLVLFFNRHNHHLPANEFTFGEKLFRSNSYDDQFMNQENWINSSSFDNQNQNFGLSNRFSPQQEPHSSIASRQFYLPTRVNSFPLTNQSFYQTSNPFDSMSPYHNNQRATNLLINGMRTNSPFNSSSSSQSPYSTTALQARSNDCATITHPTISNHISRNPIACQNCLTGHFYSNNDLSYLHRIDMNTKNANYPHPSARNSGFSSVNSSMHRNMHNGNFVDYNEENKFIPRVRNQLDYEEQDLIFRHNQVRRHRSLPAGSFKRQLNLHPLDKHPQNNQTHQRSASFRTPRRLCEIDQCFRVRINKSRPILGIAIEGGINVPNQTLPRVISIHESGSASESGEIKIGQIILKINDVPTEGLTHSEVARLLAHSYYTKKDSFIELLVKDQGCTDS